MGLNGHALMAEWSKSLRSLTTAWIRFPAGTCEKVANDFGLVGGFHRVLWFPAC